MYKIHLFMRLYKGMNTKNKFHSSSYAQILQPTHLPYTWQLFRDSQYMHKVTLMLSDNTLLLL